jgi:hypothetical protein
MSASEPNFVETYIATEVLKRYQALRCNQILSVVGQQVANGSILNFMKYPAMDSSAEDG